MMNAGEKAMALVDGQLSPVEVPALVQELARNTALVAELQGYLAISRSRIAQAYAAKTDEQVPRRLIDAVMETPVAAETPRSAAPASPLGRLVDWLRDSYRVPRCSPPRRSRSQWQSCPSVVMARRQPTWEQPWSVRQAARIRR